MILERLVHTLTYKLYSFECIINFTNDLACTEIDKNICMDVMKEQNEVKLFKFDG